MRKIANGARRDPKKKDEKRPSSDALALLIVFAYLGVIVIGTLVLGIKTNSPWIWVPSVVPTYKVLLALVPKGGRSPRQWMDSFLKRRTTKLYEDLQGGGTTDERNGDDAAD